MSLIGDIKHSYHENNEAFFFSTIIGQMMSNSVADVIERRVIDLCGGELTAKAILSLGSSGIRSAGVSLQKAEYMTLFAQYTIDHPSFLQDMEAKSDEQVIEELTALRGIGNWTAKMYLLFVLNREDVLPFEDGAFLQAYRWLYQTSDSSPKAIKHQCECWKPYSSIAARYMYRILDYGFTKYETLEAAERAKGSNNDYQRS